MTRIPTLFAFERSLEAMNQRRAAMVQDQQQLATGKRIATPSDDPLASAQAAGIRSQLARMALEERMMGFARSMLAQAENTMAGAGDALQFAREQLVAAGNGAYAPADRALIAQQLEGTREQLLVLANQRDGAGGYVFGGQGTTVAPFDPATGAPRTPPNAGEQSTGLDASWTTSQDGRAIFGDPAAGTSVFDTLDAAIALLRQVPAPNSDTLDAGLRTAMEGVDATLERLLLARTKAGEQMRAIDARERVLESGELEATGRLSALVDTDYAAAISRFQNNQTALEAAMTTYAQVSRLTLFDYL